MYPFNIVSVTTVALASFGAADQLLPRANPYGPHSCSQSGSNGSAFDAVVPLGSLPGLFASSFGQENPGDWIQIRETSMLYPLAIDGKDFASLDNIFAPDVVANLSQGPIIDGLPALKGVLAASVAKVGSHHNLGTQDIKIEGNGCSAESITYFHASLLGQGPSYGQIVYALGQYQDAWTKQSVGWRISKRNLVYMAPFIGNVSIVE